jgi:hypothetical protein
VSNEPREQRDGADAWPVPTKEREMKCKKCDCEIFEYTFPNGEHFAAEVSSKDYPDAHSHERCLTIQLAAAKEKGNG